MDRAIEIRAVRRGDLVTVMRTQSHGQTISSHRNETLTARVRIDREAALAARLDEDNRRTMPEPPPCRECGQLPLTSELGLEDGRCGPCRRGIAPATETDDEENTTPG